MLALALATLLRPASAAPSPRPIVRVVTIDGLVLPRTEAFLSREIDAAEREGDAVVVVRLDSPGGYAASVRAASEALLAADVPVVVWVGPEGARARGGAVFLVLAAELVAAADDARLGDVDPSLGFRPADPQVVAVARDRDEALARSLAGARHRDPDAAARGVVGEPRDTAAARARGLVDLRVDDLGALVRALDGRSIATPTGVRTLRLGHADVVRASMDPSDRVLEAVSDPNVAYVLFVLGCLGLAFEVYTAGFGIAGAVGGIALLLALFGFGALPFGVIGVLLVVTGLALVIAELHAKTYGLLSLLGLVVLAVGSLLLYRPISSTPGVPEVRVAWWIVAVMIVTVAAVAFFALRPLVRRRSAELAVPAAEPARPSSA